MNLESFFHMGGYAFYVWSSYGIALLVLAYNVYAPLRLKRKLLRDLRRRGQRRRSAQ